MRANSGAVNRGRTIRVLSVTLAILPIAIRVLLEVVPVSVIFSQEVFFETVFPAIYVIVGLCWLFGFILALYLLLTRQPGYGLLTIILIALALPLFVFN